MVGDDQLTRSPESLAAVEFVGNDPQAIDDPDEQAQRALAVDPLRETMHLAIVEAYLRLGQRVVALGYALGLALRQHFGFEVFDAHFTRNRRRGRRIVAGQHRDRDSHRVERADCCA